MVFFAGLPGVGKSLLLQQFALMAQAQGRQIHLLQWDKARPPFETTELLAKYPEIEGVTHAAIRKAVGLWSRAGVLKWHLAHPDPKHLLVGEVPLIGNRLIELVQVRDDQAENLLAASGSVFVLPVPSQAVRDHIEAAREKSIAAPQHQHEAYDAPPNVLRALSREVLALGQRLGCLPAETDLASVDYDPTVYQAVYQHLMQHRDQVSVAIDQIFPTQGSVYSDGDNWPVLAPSPEEVHNTLAQIERDYTPETLAAEVERWAEVGL